MPLRQDFSWLEEVRDEVLEEQGLDDEDLPHIEDMVTDEIAPTAEQIATLDRRITDETGVDDALTAEVDNAWTRLREMVLEEVNRLAEEEGVDMEEMAESQEVLADAVADRCVAEAEGG